MKSLLRSLIPSATPLKLGPSAFIFASFPCIFYVTKCCFFFSPIFFAANISLTSSVEPLYILPMSRSCQIPVTHLLPYDSPIFLRQPCSLPSITENHQRLSSRNFHGFCSGKRVESLDFPVATRLTLMPAQLPTALPPADSFLVEWTSFLCSFEVLPPPLWMKPTSQVPTLNKPLPSITSWCQGRRFLFVSPPLLLYEVNNPTPISPTYFSPNPSFPSCAL